MKDSGIEWIGRIPCNWKLNKISSLYELRNQKVSDRDYQPLSVSMKGIVPQLETAAKTNAHDDRKLVRKGDFAINSRSDRRGSCGISPYDGSVSLINTVLCPRENMDPGYYNWLFHTTQFSDEFYKWGHGIVDDLWTTGWQDMKKICIPDPKIDEQQKISNFLNLKCSKIDSILTSFQDQIDTLEQYKKSVITEAVTKGLNPDVEMKDSGVEWIGMTPNHWVVTKVKYSCKTRENNNWSYKDGNLDYFSLENIDSWNYRYMQTSNVYDLLGSKLCYKNDVVFGKLRPYLAKTFLVDYNRCCSSEFAIFYDFKGLQKYLLFLVTSKGFVDTVDFSTYGTKMPRANIEFIKDMLIAIPPAEEQQQIVDFLDAKCSQIDSIISQKKEQIETLKEYKKSLIYEYVTGKKEVPNA